MNIYLLRQFLFSLTIAFSLTSGYAQNDEEVIIYVKNTTAKTSGNNVFTAIHTYGRSWDTAFRFLHDALRFGDPNATQIWIAGGHYYVDRGVGMLSQSTDTTHPSILHLNPFTVINRNVKIYGGFAGTETSLDQRDPEANPTYLDGNVHYKEANPLPVPDNIFNDNNRFSKRIMIVYNSTITLDGLTFQYVYGGGSAASADTLIPEADRGKGAFIYAVNQSALTINNCVFRYGTQGFHGQMIYAFNNSEPIRITNSRFTESGNASTFFHNGPYEGNGEMIFENCVFDNLQQTEGGNGGYLFANQSGNGVIEFKNGLLYNNDNLQMADPPYLTESASTSIVIENALWLNNNAHGRDFLNVLSLLSDGTVNLSIINSSFINNISSSSIISTAGRTGSNKLNLTMHNNVFYGNKTSEEGSTLTEILKTGSNQVFQSTSISHNATDNSNSKLLTNNDYNTGKVDLSSKSLTGLFVGQTDADGNFDADGADDKWFTDDDGFVPKENGVLHNVGHNDAVANINADIKGHARLQGDTVDIGAYEFGGSALGQENSLSILPSLLIYPNPVQKGSALYVDLSGLRTQQLIIRDVSGKHVKTLTLDGEQEKVDVGALSSGSYLVMSVNDRNDYKAFKLVVE